MFYRAAFVMMSALLAAGPAWAASPTLVVQAAEIADTVAVAATVEGAESGEARARIGGTLEQVLVSRGDMVKKGAVLGVVKDRKLGQQAAGLNTQVATAARNLARLKELLPLDAASPLEVEQAEAQLAALRAQAQATTQTSTDGRILAPFDGQFVALRAISGTVMMPGESLGTVAAAPMVLKLALPERHANAISVSATAALADDAGTPLGDATITSLYPQVSGGRFVAEARLPEMDRLPPVGTRLTARVPVGTRTALLLPQTYLSKRFGLAYAHVQGLGEVVVQTGYPQPDGQVEILSGLRAGDVVVQP